MINQEKGSPYGRGMCDSYYRRPVNPHKVLGGWPGTRVELTEQSEIDEYMRGYSEQDEHKEWY